jgi:hypothetical protein
MEAIAGMSLPEYSAWLTRTQHDMFRAAAARQPDVPSSVRTAHDKQRNGEPPRPYSRALEVRSAADTHAAAPNVLRDADGVPKPWSSALAARRVAEGR